VLRVEARLHHLDGHGLHVALAEPDRFGFDLGPML
jgi:hypothetical protein